MVFTLGFFFFYWLTVKGEEQRLAFKFGEAYADYVQNVPRFLPRLVPYKRRAKASFAFHRVWGHGEHITILAIIALFLVLWLRQEFCQNHQPLEDAAGLWVLSTTVAVGLLLFSAIIFRWSKRVRKARNPR